MACNTIIKFYSLEEMFTDYDWISIRTRLLFVTPNDPKQSQFDGSVNSVSYKELNKFGDVNCQFTG